MYNFNEANSRLNSNSTKWDRYKKQGIEKDVIPLWVADMDYNCLPEVQEAIVQRAKHGIFGYTDASEECIQSIIDWEKRHHQLDIQKENIVFATGVVYAIGTAVELLVKKDEKVIVLPPVYPPFFNVPSSLSKEVVYSPLIKKEEWEIDYDGLEKMLQADPKIKMLIFCNPHNPVGRCWSKEELRKLLEITHRYGITVVSDEIHGDLILEPYHQTSMLGVDEKYNQNIIVLAAPTKTFNLAGLKISYALIKNEQLRADFAKLAKSSGLSSINIFGYEALTAAYNHGDQWLKECLDAIQDNFIWLKNFLEENLPLCKFEIPQATYLAWVDFSGYNIPDNFQALLKEEAYVELNAGAPFKAPASFQRINCACPRSTLEEGMKRIKEYLDAHSW